MACKWAVAYETSVQNFIVLPNKFICTEIAYLSRTGNDLSEIFTKKM
jgi:hypothetical protein